MGNNKGTVLLIILVFAIFITMAYIGSGGADILAGLQDLWYNFWNGLKELDIIQLLKSTFA